MTNDALLFTGPAGQLGAAAVKVALTAGVSGKAALMFGRICSWNGTPLWELRANLKDHFCCSTRTITRYFRELVDAGLCFNKPAPIDAIPPGCKRPLPFRVWYKWAVGLPELREAVKTAGREAYERWRERFERERRDHVTRSRLGAIIGSIVHPKPKAKPTATPATDKASPTRRWTVAEIDEELARTPTREPPSPDDTS